MKFSIVLICRNEAKTIPRAIAGLKEFRQRGGEIVLLDTGSTDNSADIARLLGCVVEEVGDRFKFTIDAELAQQINECFVVEGEAPVVKEGDKLFDYSKARNYAATLAKNNMVAMPDCDEVFTRFDLDKINAAIDAGNEQLEYDFVFAHDEHGNEIIKFLHCKFYDRTKMHWNGIVHEVLAGSAKRLYLTPDICKLEHWQLPSDHRCSYLTGLALDCFQNPQNDRNSHYFGREMLGTGRPKSAYKEFEHHKTLNGWHAETAQSVIFQGDCLLAMQQPANAVQKWQEAAVLDPSRREAWMRLATHYWRQNEPQRAACHAAAALVIPHVNFYANNANHYRHEPHEILYWAMWWMGDKQGSFEHWTKAREYFPQNQKYMDDSVYYLDMINPMVSIIIPTLGRDEQTKNLVDILPDICGWKNIEILTPMDHFECRQGCPKTLKSGVHASKGEFVCFLGSDCTPKPDFLRKALECMYRKFPKADGLVSLNEGRWYGNIATHWLASKQLLPALDGEFFHTGYMHNGCDNELTGRCQLMGKYAWAEEAVIDPGWNNEDEIHRIGQTSREKDRALLKQRAEMLGFTHLLV